MVDPIQWLKFLFNPKILPSIQILLSLNVNILFAFWNEKYLLAGGWINEASALLLNIINLAAILVMPPYIVFSVDCHPVASSFALGQVAIVWLKLISYHMVNYWCRKARKQERSSVKEREPHKPRSRSRSRNKRDNQKISNGHASDDKIEKNGGLALSLITYPNNLTYKDMYYFVFSPTLCYELNFPRSPRIRKRFLLRRFFEMVS